MIRNFLKRHKKKTIIIIIVFLAAFGVYHFIIKGKNANAAGKFAEFKVTRKDISITISGSGTVKSSYRQEISPKVDGTITKVNFKQGDSVKEGELMIELEDQNIRKQIERTKLSIKQAEKNLEKANQDILNLSVTAPIPGQVINFNVNAGDNINKGADICTINDNSRLVLTVPFNKNQAGKIYAGQKAEVYLQDYMQVVQGRVNYVDKRGRIVDGGGKMYDVEIEISNPGTLSEGSKASARINGEMSMDSSTVTYKSSRKVKAEVSGIVKSVSIKSNQQVFAGQELFRLENNDLYDQLLSNQIKVGDLKLQLDSQLEDQQGFKVFAPVSGIIVKQDVKIGDNVKVGNVLSTVADYSRMEFEIPVDELDIAKISVGMEASVTVDALTRQRFRGEVASVANEGTSQNGVATYPVIVKILDPKDIKSGMNANAEIIIQKKENALSVPISAIQRMGRQSLVYTKKKPGENNQDITAFQVNRSENQTSGSRNASNSNSSNTRTNTGQSSSAASRMQAALKSLGPNMTVKSVETGMNNDSDIEIIQGLSEGDSVYVPVAAAASNFSNNRNASIMPFGGGAMPGGMQRNFGGSNGRQGNNSRTGGGQSGNR